MLLCSIFVNRNSHMYILTNFPGKSNTFWCDCEQKQDNDMLIRTQPLAGQVVRALEEYGVKSLMMRLNQSFHFVESRPYVNF